ncbi:hypothetical protein H6768_04285 [Candidatus Peribacteria bacterium]|nr:hypothetical protein [Candidatus Peribacteria bacterium]
MSFNTTKQKIFSLVPQNIADFLEQMKETGQKRHIPNISWNTAYFLIQTL